jgi:hypothetical protein
MNPYLRLIFLVAILFIVPSVFARLGDTPDQCDERYGSKYTEIGGQGFWAAERKYEKGGVQITIRFLRNESGARIAEYIGFKLTNTTTNRMTPSKIEGLLNSVAPEWIPITLITPPPVNEKLLPDPKRTLNSSTAKKRITIEQSAGLDKRKAEKEALDRQNLLNSIAAKNSEIQVLKNKIKKITTLSTDTAWQSPKAYAVSTTSSLVLFSAAFLTAYDHQAEIEKARQAKEDSSPLPGF